MAGKWVLRMETKKEHYLRIICEKLAMYQSTISLRNSNRLFDINIAAEDFVCGLLNQVYGFHLMNLNSKAKNYPGIDLGDIDNGIAVQVTSDNSRKKVKNTLQTFLDYGYIANYRRLIIFVLGKKRNNTPLFDSGSLGFLAQRDILDFDDIVQEINRLDTERIESVCRYLETELILEGVSSCHPHTNLFQMRNDSLENQSAAEIKSLMSKEAEIVYAKIQKLKHRFWLDESQIGKIRKALREISSNTQELRMGSGIFEQYVEIFRLIQKAFLFIQSFDRQELEWLNDVGVNIYIQVVQGHAQVEAEHFFSLYGKSLDLERKLQEYGIGVFDRYTFEQISRIVISYENILGFDPNMLNFSPGYICEEKRIGKILAVSVTGKANKIYVWDTDARTNQPVAVLAGLFESVWDLKVFRIDGNLYVTARGVKRIYLWKLSTPNYSPIAVYNADNTISSYTLYRFRNKKLYIAADVLGKLYLWAMGGEERPSVYIKTRTERGDAYIFETEIEIGKSAYYILGNSADATNINNYIYRIKENRHQELEIEYLCDETQLIGNIKDPDGIEYGIDSYQMMPDRPVLGVLTRKELFLYDILQKKKIFSLPQKGQQILDFQLLTDDTGDLYLLTYHLYNCRKDDQQGLVRCYCIRNGSIICQQEWFHSDTDIKRAVMSTVNNEVCVYFNQYGDNIIYTATYDKNDYSEFYTLPNSMLIVDMVIE